MSVPSPYSQRGAVANAAEPREDCRDYLRTGRCKYGASCKYNHPPNVQSGGGMKAPVDPSEPMFPIRPNEPVCQYYMKHGTCKFGQACKFHHPPQSSVTAALVSGGAVVVNMGRKNDVQQMVMNPMSGDAAASNGAPMMLQFLPQRPDEQDCIFFLKNGRCKYGATCRYHHPINFNQRRDDGRRQRVQVQQVPEGFLPHSNVQFIGQYQQGPSSSSNASHMVVTDSPVTYMAVDGSSGKGSYQPMPVVSNDGFCAPTGVPMSHNQDHTSSTSSIASSYDTANSNLDHLVPHTEQSSGLWNRQKNNGSHASLNAYDSSNTRQRIAMPQSTSDGNIATRRHRAASYGSASDSGVYVDATGSLGRATSGGAKPTSNSAGSVPTWHTERTPSFENVRRGVTNQYLSTNRGELASTTRHEEGPIHRSGSAPSSSGHGRRPPGGGRRRSNEAVDAGLSMMTSALLTMLDTPEEAAEGYEYYEDIDHQGASQLRDSRGPVMTNAGQDAGLTGAHDTNSVSGSRLYHMQEADRRQDGDMFGGMIMNSPGSDGQYQDPRNIHGDDGSNWLPNWQGSKSLEGDTQSMSVIKPGHTAPNSPHSSSNVGLFLP